MTVSKRTKITAAAAQERFVYVDALRGIAALMVLSHHLLYNTVLEVALRRILPSALCDFCTFGARGVQIFFVISGFVIAHSLRAVPATLGGAGNFILRRQLRLDPPYWTLVILTLVDLALENRIPSFTRKPLPTAGGLFANLFYLQHIVAVPQIVGVSWTLCQEVQFYLFFILAHLFGRWGSTDNHGVSPVTVGMLYLMGGVSLFYVNDQTIFVRTFIPFWCYFAIGALCYWSYRKMISKWVFATFLVLFAVAGLRSWSLLMAVGFVTVVSLFIVGEFQSLGTFLSNRVLQYFGRISYSLYLVHFLVLSAIMRGGYKLTGTSRWPALMWFILAAGVSIIVAHFFHKFIEVPSMRVASKLKPKKSSPEVNPQESVDAGAVALSLPR